MSILGLDVLSYDQKRWKLQSVSVRVYLNSLSVVTENVHSNNRLVKLRIGALCDVVIQVFLVPQGIHTLEYEFEESLQVLRVGTRNENIRVTMGERSSDGEP